jgi:hypothetical protein
VVFCGFWRSSWGPLSDDMPKLGNNKRRKERKEERDKQMSMMQAHQVESRSSGSYSLLYHCLLSYRITILMTYIAFDVVKNGKYQHNEAKTEYKTQRYLRTYILLLYSRSSIPKTMTSCPHALQKRTNLEASLEQCPWEQASLYPQMQPWLSASLFPPGL